MKKVILFILLCVIWNHLCNGQSAVAPMVLSPIGQTYNESNNQPSHTTTFWGKTRNNRYNKPVQIFDDETAYLDLISNNNSDTQTTDSQSNELGLELTMPYRRAYAELLQMLNSDSTVSLIKAVYIVENAFLNEKLSFDKFQALILNQSKICEEIIKLEKLDPRDNTVKNYAIQNLYSGDLNKKYPTLKYDFDDFRGDKDWTKMFVTKLLLTNKGQCHSMPLLYLMLAERLNAKAYMALAPEHSFIIFPSEDGNLYNFETTQGKLVTNNAIMMSGFITSTAIKNRLYMDTLGTKQLITLCLLDLEQGYISKFKYDSFTKSINDKILSVAPNNIQALMLKADSKTAEFKNAAKKIGYPPVDDLYLYPDVYKLYKEMHECYANIDNSGYQAMPPEAYQKWLSSLNDIQHQREYEKLLIEIRNKSRLSQTSELKY